MEKAEPELFTDYLICTFGAAAVTADISHERRCGFFRQVKATVLKIEQDDGVLVFDGTLQKKFLTGRDEVVCWHYEHYRGR